MRSYEKTHPWINFNLDLRRVDYRLWIALGEAVSKCEHLATVPLQPETAHNLHLLYLAKGIRATTAIEGNTLSEEEVIDRLEGKLKLPPSRQYLGQEIDNIRNACNQITDQLFKEGQANITVKEIKWYNEVVSEKLPREDDFVPGMIRRHSVGVGAYRGAPPEDCESLLEKMCNWLNDLKIPDNDNIVLIGILKAILAHLYIAWIHPFGDGNGRTARLVEFRILLSHSVPTPAAHLLSNHYNLTRTEYYRQLDYTSRSKGDIFPFIHYAVQGFVDGLKGQIDEIQKQHLSVGWEIYIHNQFKDKIGTIDNRRRTLALELTRFDKPVPINKIRQVSPIIAEMYADKTMRTIRRDLLELIRLRLVKKIGNAYNANKDIMLSFLPQRSVL
ncbi:MAG: Fic family protein [Nitrospirae bacterium]|nr:Fic family protein [Nitrospirota bacterium]